MLFDILINLAERKRKRVGKGVLNFRKRRSAWRVVMKREVKERERMGKKEREKAREWKLR